MGKVEGMKKIGLFMVILAALAYATPSWAYPQVTCPTSGWSESYEWGPGCFGSCGGITYKVTHYRMPTWWSAAPHGNTETIVQRAWTSTGGWDYRCYDVTPVKPWPEGSYQGSVDLWSTANGDIHFEQFIISDNLTLAGSNEYKTTDGFNWTFVTHHDCASWPTYPQFCTFQ